MKPNDVGSVVTPSPGDIDIYSDPQNTYVHLHPRGSNVWVRIDHPRRIAEHLNHIAATYSPFSWDVIA